MKVKCNRAALHEAVQLASSIVPSRTPKPILQCAMLSADSDKLTVTATDNEITIKYTLQQVQIDETGEVVIPAARLAAILHETSDETVDLEVSESNLQVTSQDITLSAGTGQGVLQAASPFLPWTITPGGSQEFEIQMSVPGGTDTVLLDVLRFAFEIEGL